jgi:hypothetical protein
MFHTGLADPYYNEQFVSRWDWLYETERHMLLVNYNSPDTSATARNIISCLKHYQEILISL